MPSERFYRLPEEKRNKIRDACLKEYLRSGFGRAFVGRLIREAQISRGSFYSYFDSRQDVLEYLCSESVGKFYDCGAQCLKESAGDIWAMLELFLERAIRICEEEKKNEFWQSLMGSRSRDAFLKDLWDSEQGIDGETKRKRLERQIYEKCVGVTLRAMSWERFTAFFEIAMTCVGMEIGRFFDGAPLEQVQEHFRTREEVLRSGAGMARRPVMPGRRERERVG